MTNHQEAHQKALTDLALKGVRATKREAAVLALRELAKTAEDGYTGWAAYGCRDIETDIASMVAAIANQAAGRLEAEAQEES